MRIGRQAARAEINQKREDYKIMLDFIECFVVFAWLLSPVVFAIACERIDGRRSK